MAVVKALDDGGMGAKKVILQRPDIKNQQARVAAAYAVFQQNVQCVANDRCDATLTTKQSLDDLEKEIHVANSLYKQEDPVVPELYPWTTVIYIALAVLIVGVMMFGCYRGIKKGGKSA